MARTVAAMKGHPVTARSRGSEENTGRLSSYNGQGCPRFPCRDATVPESLFPDPAREPRLAIQPPPRVPEGLIPANLSGELTKSRIVRLTITVVGKEKLQV